jgi:hypothetical protein
MHFATQREKINNVSLSPQIDEMLQGRGEKKMNRITLCSAIYRGKNFTID